ncbi:phage tail protein [Streptosporangium sp. NBC_01755]|uniref:phage tail protein n=1 Tax=Streptosporangium sp. NBC_01755 TaxID=2975949 RepID=UPI002DD88907|nr:phage tail protein [Streptosporangium sp. NBC_01755]WSD01112.1 phage tail protein [Streptosporangium sp. NBC_01755]
MSYPLTSLHFEVKWGDSQNTSSFSEVSGLTMEADAIEYRGGADRALTVRKIPGLRKYGNVTLKRGIVPKGEKSGGIGLYEWFNTIRAGTVARRPVTVSLLNEAGDPVMTWKIKDAWPVKIEGPGLNATGNEIAIETLEFAHEGVEVIVG